MNWSFKGRHFREAYTKFNTHHLGPILTKIFTAFGLL